MDNEQLKAHYDVYYDEQSEWRRLGAADKSGNVKRAWLEAGGSQPPRSVLEIGSGDGSVVEAMQSNYGWHVQGIDISLSGVQIAKSRGLEVQVFDGDHLPFEDRAFDVIVMTHVVEHLDNPRVLLREAYRCATYVFVEVPLERTWRTKKNYRWTSLGHINIYDPLLIRHLLQSCGEVVVCAEFTTNPSRAVHRYHSGTSGTAKWIIRESLLKVMPSLARRLFSYHHSILVKVAS
jgi:ubiquinone/menaquinone biosynthesis C-methylase UbiE